MIRQPYKTYNNPLQCKDQDDENKRYNIFAVFYSDIDFPFLKGLNYRMNFSQNLIQGRHFYFNEWGENFTGYGYKTNGHTYSYTVDNILTYKNRFGKHSVNATFVYGIEKRNNESTTASAQNFTNMALGYNNLDAGQADLQTASSSAWKETSLYTMFRVGYTFNDRYMFTGTVRRDGFSGFGKNHKYGVFPSAAIAWLISEEDFFKDDVKWVNMLKLRTSYGENGNRTVGRYQTLAKMGSQAGYLFGDGANAEQIQWISSLANEDLKWETTTTMNFGADFGFLNNRIFGTLEYYRSKTKNLLFNINIPEINGIGSIPSNIGKLSNHGIEFNITGIPVQTQDFSWSVTFNFSRNRNKVDKVYGIDNDGDGKEDDLVANKIFIGKPYDVCYDYNIIGMWQVADRNSGTIPDGFTYGTYKVEDINDDGKYTADADRKILGYTDPSYRFSIQNTFTYKNWELKFLINSIQGGKKYYYGQPGSSLPNPDNIYQMNLFNFDYWTPENPNARYRQLGYYTAALGETFSPYVQRSFVRLQDLTLSYTLPESFLCKYKISRAKVYVTGSNLLTFSDWDGWDPETGTGLNTGAYPLMKSYTLGINIEF
jgi:TonB-linked SusC/RagA family outer membrane protein